MRNAGYIPAFLIPHRGFADARAVIRPQNRPRETDRRVIPRTSRRALGSALMSHGGEHRGAVVPPPISAYSRPPNNSAAAS